MDHAIIIDGDIQPDYGPVYGLLAGWSKKEDKVVGSWAIELKTIKGVIRFTSSHSGSALAVSRVAEILCGDGGIENPNRKVSIHSGCLVLDAERVVPFSDFGVNDRLEGVHVTLAAREVYDLIHEDCFKTEQALLAAIDQIAARGGVKILTETDHFQLNDGTLIEWKPQLRTEDMPVLARLLFIRDHLPAEKKVMEALNDRFADSLQRLGSLRLEFTCGKDGGFKAYAFGMLEYEVVDISLVLDLFFLRQSWTTAALLHVAKEGL